MKRYIGKRALSGLLAVSYTHLDVYKRQGIKILEKLAEKEKIINVAEHISEILQIQELTYAEGFDKICLIVDRDPLSFSEEQYDQVVQICKERQIDFYVTNPCFEFWLLLHFPDHKNLDPVDVYKRQAMV